MVKKRIVSDVLKMVERGWRPYEGRPTAEVYDALNCEQRPSGLSYWFAKGPAVCCVGCERACTMPCPPPGFQLPLFTYPPPSGPVFRMSPDELLSKRKLLQVHEVAYVLNVSTRHVHRMIQHGRLLATKKRPARVPVEEVRAALNEVDLWTPESEPPLDEVALALNNQD